MNSIKNQIQKHGNKLFSDFSGVQAIGVGYKKVGGFSQNKLSMVFNVIRKKPLSELTSKELIPKKIKGIVTDVQESGLIVAQKLRTDKWRPAPGGVSIGHPDITAGTLGCLVQRNGEVMILSNNHVMAVSNDGKIGDTIIQPGTYDGGTITDRIATLEDFVPIKFGLSIPDCPVGNSVVNVLNWLSALFGHKTRVIIQQDTEENLVDAAIARPHNIENVKSEILEIGEIAGLHYAGLGDKVQKSGRTTLLTNGTVDQVDVLANVSYGAGKTALFSDQILTGYMSAGGDSGSAVLTMDNKLTGLLFAGSDKITIINRIENVFDLLGLSIFGG